MNVHHLVVKIVHAASSIQIAHAVKVVSKTVHVEFTQIAHAVKVVSNDKPRFDSNDDNRGNRVDYKPRQEGSLATVQSVILVIVQRNVKVASATVQSVTVIVQRNVKVASGDRPKRDFGDRPAT